MRKRALLASATALIAVTAAIGVRSFTASASTVPAAASPKAAAAGFVHPGVFVSKAQLDFVKAKVAAKAAPWSAAYSQMISSTYASLTRTPTPRATVECGPYSNPDLGCTNERQDAIAAYTDALAWYISGNPAYAKESIKLMDAWSATIKSHTNSNAKLQTAWAGTNWPRAAEIIKYTYSSWPNAARFATMLKNVYLPEIINGVASNGNWELSEMDAASGIAVFLDDRAGYDKAIARFQQRAASYVYIASDGSQPKYPPAGEAKTKSALISYWQGQSTFVPGLAQETCRDFVHTGYGLDAIAETLETTHAQGNDLWPALAPRVSAGFEFQTQFENGVKVPSNICGGKVNKGIGPVTEVAYNALHNRLGLAMPQTGKYTTAHRPQGTDILFVAWETLTHANNPN